MRLKTGILQLLNSSSTLNGACKPHRLASQGTINRCDAAGQQQKITALIVLFIFFMPFIPVIHAQDSTKTKNPVRILYGTASFYSNKFQGRKTASGELFDQNKMTAACNVLPLGTWIRVTNLRNKRSVIVKVNDRLHTKMKRIVDLSRVAATRLGFIGSGLTRVKVEVLGKKKPAQ